ncbi:ornithine carbamoyltransferase [Streptomyces malaysiense]|uniref:Ornithine carbamoyltransferase n=1 Tax=Streptomyces malaysiense TaxID=1428626 RepID=A0A1J4PXP1_9ACTN|nr:ornithine carbamoyltransferase [Streptomyces malaysiense]OIK25466.1 ornithine carbamoyltransferase [Streptomyces malaysiense]
MTTSLYGRSFLKETDFSAEEFRSLIDLAGELKAAKKDGTEVPRLTGRNIALVFEKTSTRTRCAFETAAYDQGAHVTYLDPSGSHIGHKESMKDTARVLGRMFDGIEYRGAGQELVEELARYAGVPVWNGLTNEWHPTQMLADLLTMREHSGKPYDRISLAYVGDARNNVANSLLVSAALLGMDVTMVAPRALWNPEPVRAAANDLARRSGARPAHTEDVTEGVAGADFIYTDVWLSMGEPQEMWAERVAQLRPYQVDETVLKATGNPDVGFLHCLPALHDRSTELGEAVHRLTGLDALEVTDEVFESHHSLVFDQAENRLHTIKAVMVATLGR